MELARKRLQFLTECVASTSGTGPLRDKSDRRGGLEVPTK